MLELVLAAALWISQNTHYEFTDRMQPHLPVVEFVHIDELEPNKDHHYGLMAGYDRALNRILIREDWELEAQRLVDDLPSHTTLQTLDEILVHELVHWYQFQTGTTFRCQNLEEFEAYKIQRDYLESQNIETWIDGFFLFHYSLCPGEK